MTLSEQPDVASAQATAQEQHSRVEITDERTETSTTFANPDGTITVDTALGAVRVHRATGWVPVDMRLVKTAEGWVPKASPTPVTFTAGGTGSAVVLPDGSKRSMKLSWGSNLPAPTVSGSTATYALSATQNLVLRATPEGFEQSVVLTAPPASAPTVKLPLMLTGLRMKTTAHGGFDAVAADGTAKFSVAPPVMYSAARDPETEDRTQVQVLDTDLTGVTGGQRLDLAPTAAFLNDPATVYPVTIDPVVASASRFGDTWITAGNTTPKASDHRFAIGVISGQPARALVRFNEDSFLGAKVTSASLKLRNYFSEGCTAKTVSAYPVSETYSNPEVVWSTQPVINGAAAYKSTASFAYGDEDAGCNNGYGKIDVTKMVDGWASGAIPMHGIELRASETDATQRKYFCAMNLDTTGVTACTKTAYFPTLSITYNSYPETAETPTHSPGSSSTSATTPGWTTSATPSLRAVVDDVDGSKARALFDIYQGSTKIVSKLAGSLVATPGISKVTVPAGTLTNGSTYTVRAWGDDGTLTAKAVSTDLDAFTVDTTKPVVPVIGSDFGNNQWRTQLAADGKIHLSATTTTTDAKTVQWGVNDTSLATSIARAGAGSADLAFTPVAGRSKYVVRARVVDPAGNVGPSATWTVLYGEGPFVEPLADIQVTPAAAPAAGTVSLVSTPTPTLTADSGPIPGATIGYDFQVTALGSSTALASGTGTGTSAATPGSWSVPAGILAAGRTYTVRTRVRDDTHTGPWTPDRSLIVDLPSTPTGLDVVAGPDSWTLSAVTSRPSGGAVVTPFLLWAADGTALNGGQPVLGSGGAGSPATAILPTGLLAAGADFQFSAQACIDPAVVATCTPVTGRQSAHLTAQPTFATTTLALSGTKIKSATSGVNDGGCPDAACSLKQTAPLALGDDTGVFVRIDASAIPATAAIVSATADLSSAVCTAACRATGLDVQTTTGVWAGTTGPDLAATASAEVIDTTFASATALDITAGVDAWQEARAGDLGLLIQPSDLDSSLSLTSVLAAKVSIVYTMPAVPSPVTNAHVLPGDHAVLLSWSAPEDPWGADAPAFRLQVRNSSGVVVATKDVQESPAIVSGLTPGSGYTATITASNPSGSSAALTTAAFAVLDLATDTVSVETVGQLHAALNRISTAAAAGPSEALAGLTRATGVADAVSARTPDLVQLRTTLAARDEATSSITWTPTEQMLGQDPATGKKAVVSVWSEDQSEALTGETDGPTVESADGVELALLSDGRIDTVLNIAADATAEQAEPDDQPESEVTATGVSAKVASATVDTAPDDAASVEVAADGLPTMTGTPDPVFTAATTKKPVNRGDAAAWAVAHYKDKPKFDNDCANFVSRALHNGGGMKANYGYYRSDKNWWQNRFNQTFSWSSANHNLNYMHHMGYDTYITQENQSSVGDLIYWDYTANGTMDHVSMITKMKKGKAFYSQHSGARKNHSLDKQWGIQLKSTPKLLVYIVHIKGS